MAGEFEPYLEVQIGPVTGTGDWESNLKLRYSCTKKFAPGLKAEDYLAVVQMLRLVADEIEAEHTPVRRGLIEEGAFPPE